MELAYAPPFSSAKDPINIAGMVAKNMIKENYRVTFWNELDSLLKGGILLIDVRTPEEFDLNGLDSSINIPLEQLRDKIKDIPKDKTIILVCQQGKKSYFAYRILKQYKFKKISSLSGGLKLYRLSILKPLFREKKEITPVKKIVLLNKKQHESVDYNGKIVEIDATGLSCPGQFLNYQNK